MFHVKRSLSTPFVSKDVLASLSEGCDVFLKGLTPGLLPLVLDSLPFKFVVVCPLSSIGSVSEDLSLYISEQGVYYGEEVYTNLENRGLVGYDRERVSLFKAALSSSFENKKFIITTEEGFSLKALPKQTPQEKFLFGPSSSYEDVLSGLVELGYNRVDFVESGGDYSIRGCVVDFFPKESLFGVRVLFDKNPSVFYFDPKTQLTTSQIPFFVLAKSKPLSSFESLKSVVSCSFKLVYLEEGGFSFFSKNPQKKEVLKIKTLSPRECLEQKKRFVFDSKCYGGFVYKKDAFVPSWLNKEVSSFRGFQGDAYVDFSSLNKGDYLVHEDFGVGEYLGLSEEEGEEYLVLKYKDAQIKVFPNLFSKVSMFKKGGDKEELDSVGRRSSWKRRVSSTRKHLSVFVESLFESYLQRKENRRVGCFLDPEIEDSFLRGFPHTDTPDQKRCWLEIKKDLCSSFFMERLLCGDVGFGKTEMAMRAAFLTSINGGGVVVGAPTTVLAKQLFVSFCDRLGPFGLKVGFLSRFVSSGEAKKVVDLFINKKIDVLVGTHRAMNNQSCLEVADLLIVDDEHKFGVRQKSVVKSLKTGINTLYMSATPIPRTLNLALSQFSNISLISTPPPLKIPPKTYVSPYSFELIKKALLFEFSRGGQSFVIHNKIQTMPSVVSKIKKTLPFLVVDFVHAQEPSNVIEQKIDLFINKKIDVLVASTILENGINIKNVNTVIINNSHLFGVSQLYQIRGRVGRGGVQAFSYLLYPKNISLSSAAKRRLNIIKNNSSLGSCYSVAMEDMRFRGAGSLFGHKQSGGVGSVGLELYGKLLREVSSKNKEQVTLVSHSLSSFIPKEYLPSSKLRVWGYKEVSLLKKEEDVSFFKEKLLNMFGAPPLPLKNLLFVRTVEIIGASSGVEKIVQHQDGVEVFLNKDVWGKKVFFLVESLKGASFRFLEGGCGFFINTPFDDNFILILNKICAKLQCEK